MKILFHHRIASRDGQAVHMDEMIEALRAAGHQVVLAGPARGGEHAEFGADAGLIAMLKRFLPRAVYEILEAVYSVPAFFRLYRAYRAFQPDFVYERYNLFLFSGLWLKRLTGVPLLLEINGPIFEERSQHDGLSLQGFARWAQGVVWRGVDYALPVTEVLAGYVRRYGVPDQRIQVIPNGINPARFADTVTLSAAKKLLGLDGRLVLGFTGFVRSWNALDRVIELIAREGERYNLHLLVVGDGPARCEIEQMALDLGVSHRVTVTGVVGRDKVGAYISAFDIALIPGVTEYASPLKLFEYLALGRAIVAPNMPNIREILTDGENAVLFDPNDKQAFAAAILRFSADQSLRSHIAGKAKATIIMQNLTWAHNAQRVIELSLNCNKKRSLT